MTGFRRFIDRAQLHAIREALEELAIHLRADLHAELWDGQTVALGPDARDDVRIVFRSPGAIRQLLLKPRLTTLVDLYGTGAIDVTGAHLLDAIRRWDHIRALKALRGSNRIRLARAALPFLFAAPDIAKQSQEAAYGLKEVQATPEAGRDDRDLISFHYDVSNEFYALFLDPEMVYSSAYFETPDTDLEEAQRAKLDMICRRLRLREGERFLDIGCGWGALMAHAVKNYGVTAHGVTLSERQLEFCKAKFQRLGICDRAKVELRDYRELLGGQVFDKIAQIEMFEHLGLDNHDRHFKTIHALLRPRGLYLHQASVRRAPPNLQNFRKTSAYMKFIRRHIFPGGDLDHIGMTLTNLERHGFEVHDVEGWREHFQKTCAIWSKRLYDRRDEAVELVGPVRTRLWILYLVLASAGFERTAIGVFQTLASRRRVGASGLPLTRRDLYE